MPKQSKIMVSATARARQRKLSRGWVRAAGLLKKKNINAVRYQQKKRAEWEG